MNINLPLDQMSTTDKLSVMETLWNDLCKNTTDMSSPTWHKDILDQREAAIKDGNDGFSDWDQAKLTIRQSVK